MHESMLLGPMDEQLSTSPSTRQQPRQSDEPTAEETSFLSAASPPSAAGGFYDPTAPAAAGFSTSFGSLPFASSLPRYSSSSLAAAGGGLRLAGGAANPLLASVLRFAGDEPEPLPGAHLRQTAGQVAAQGQEPGGRLLGAPPESWGTDGQASEVRGEVGRGGWTLSICIQFFF